MPKQDQRKHLAKEAMPILNMKFIATALTIVFTGAVLSAFPWTRDMYIGPVVLPYGQLMVPPENVLSVDGPRIMGRRDAREKLTNPRPISVSVLAEGAALYSIYCASCHGDDGSGNGKLVEYFDRTADLRDSNVQGSADGELYNAIREGGFTMPPFAAALSADERWAVVHHIRTYGNGR